MERTIHRSALAAPTLAFLGYAAVALVGFALEPERLSELPIYVAPGVGLAFLWRYGTGLWPAVTLASFVVGLMRGNSPLLALLPAAVVALMSILGCHALRARDFRPEIGRLRDALTLISVAVVVTLGSFAVLGVGLIFARETANLVMVIGAISIGTIIGTLISAPPLFMWTTHQGGRHEQVRERPFETACLWLLLLVACDAAFGGWLGTGRAHYPLAFLPFPILLWIGFRIGPRSLVTATSVSSIAAVFGTVQGLGPFAEQSPAAMAALDWLFLGMMQVTFLLLAAVISERADAEEALRAEKERAESATRAKSEFLSVMNHELRTPLNSILLATDLMLESELDEEQRDLGQTVMRAGEALRTLVSDTLDMARIEEGRMELLSADFAPAELSHGVIDVFIDAAKRKNIDLRECIDPDLPPTLRGDAPRLRQVLINLVGNALKFTDEGRIELRTTCRAQEAGIVRVRWEVCDSGAGIADKDRQAIFEPFTQVDGSSVRAHGGTGLGLAISRRLVQLMGGEIGVSSEFGRGSTFWLTISTRSPEQPSCRQKTRHQRISTRRPTKKSPDPIAWRPPDRAVDRGTWPGLS